MPPRRARRRGPTPQSPTSPRTTRRRRRSPRSRSRGAARGRREKKEKMVKRRRFGGTGNALCAAPVQARGRARGHVQAPVIIRATPPVVNGDPHQRERELTRRRSVRSVGSAMRSGRATVGTGLVRASRASRRSAGAGRSGRHSCMRSFRSFASTSLGLMGLVAACVVALAAGEARADVAPPPTSSSSSGGSDCGSSKTTAPCDGKKSGDACTLSSGGTGTCTALRCVSDSGQTLLGCASASSSSSGSSGSASDGGCSSTRASAPAGAMFAVGVAAIASLVARRRRAR